MRRLSGGGPIWRVIGYVVAAAVAALLLATISEQRLVAYESRGAVVVFALVLGLLNALVKPVLRLLTLPLTCLSFGLFALVLNAGLFALAARATPGVTVTLWGAVIGAIIASVAGGVIFSLVDER